MIGERERAALADFAACRKERSVGGTGERRADAYALHSKCTELGERKAERPKVP